MLENLPQLRMSPVNMRHLGLVRTCHYCHTHPVSLQYFYKHFDPRNIIVAHGALELRQTVENQLLRFALILKILLEYLYQRLPLDDAPPSASRAASSSESALSYGMLEAGREFDNNIVPVVDLSYISELQNWIKGAHSFYHFGNGRLLAELLKEKDKTQSEKLIQFTNVLSMNFIHEIKSQINLLTSLASQRDRKSVV